MAQFIEENTEMHPDYECLKADLYKKFIAWAEAEGESDVKYKGKRWLTTHLINRWEIESGGTQGQSS